MSQAAISINPANRTELNRYAFDSAGEVESVLHRVDLGFKIWRKETIENRVQVIRAMAKVMRRESETMSLMITREMGKPIAQAKAEIEKCAALCDWYAEHGPSMLADELRAMPNGRAFVSYQPIGAIFAVMPWNFPFWQVMRGAVAILLGGNAYVLKHSSNVMGAAYMLEKAWTESGLPAGVFAVVNVGHEEASRIIADRRIAAATVTGSVRAGRAVAATAGANLKKSVLELGGSDPFIVLSDANLEAAVKNAVESRYQNTGQVCIAAKRFIVEESAMPAFTDLFVEKVKNLKTGNPEAKENYVGPMARADLRNELHKQVQASVSEGARLILGGHFIGGELDGGNYYAPTILTNVKPGMTAFKEEIFGPVASLIVARDSEHALELANQSDFGLCSAIWSSDEERARTMARRMETGGVFINGMSATDPRVPVGGVKQSGYGRELSHFGMHEFLNAQTVWIDRV